MQKRDTILTINVVEKELVRAVAMHSKALGRPLKGLVLVNKSYAEQPGRPKDTTGLFKEVICDFDNHNEVQNVLKPYTDRFLAATCRYEEAIQDFGKIIPFLPYLHTPSPSALLWSTEKPLMRDRLKNYDATLVPRYQYMEKEDLPNLTYLVKDFCYPVVVKPSGLCRSLLVARCDNLEELKKRLAYTFRVIKHAYDRDQYPGKPAVLVEEMMQGGMYSVDAYVSQTGEIQCLPPIKVVTGQAMGLPGFYGYERNTVTDLTEKEIQAAYRASISAIRAVNLSSSTAHVELYLTQDGWKIIELCARIGGFRDTLYREAYGIEHFYNDLSVRMGQKPKIKAKQFAHAAALNIYAEDEGYITGIDGVEEARKISSVISLEMHAEVGDIALFSQNGGYPLASIVLSSKERKQLRKDITLVRDLIKIHVKKLRKQKSKDNKSAMTAQAY